MFGQGGYFVTCLGVPTPGTAKAAPKDGFRNLWRAGFEHMQPSGYEDAGHRLLWCALDLVSPAQPTIPMALYRRSSVPIGGSGANRVDYR
jgi:hypothetical protein